MTSKLTAKERANILIKDGKIISQSYFNGSYTYIIDCYGQRFRIDNATSDKPKITQYENGEDTE